MARRHTYTFYALPALLANLVASLPAAAQQASQPLTRPGLVEQASLNAGDTAWLLTSTVLVILMTIPGLALFYAGMVRKKNVLGTMAHSFAACCIASVLWVVVGYSIAFTPG